MKVLVTGGSGFIGSALVRRLAAMGWAVRVVSRQTSRPVPPGVELVPADLTAPDCPFAQLVDGCDAVINCAGEIRDPARMRALHVEATRNLANAAYKQADATGHPIRWVQLSSVGAYGPAHPPHAERTVTETTPPAPVGAYEITKTQADTLLQQLADPGRLPLVILRPSNVFGPGMPNTSLHQLTRALRRKRFFAIGSPGAVSPYIHAEDVVDALIACLTDPRAVGEIFNLSNDCPQETLIAALARAVGAPPPRRRLNETAVRGAVAILGRILPLPLTASRIDALVARTRYPSEKIGRILGIVPRRSVPETLAATVAPPRPAKPRLAVVTAVPMTVSAFLSRHLAVLESVYDITVITHTDTPDFLASQGLTVRVIPLAIARPIAPLRDTAALLRLTRLLRRERFDGLFSVTPKAGLLGMAAGLLAGIPRRIHMFTGQVWATRTGPFRLLLKTLDRIIAALATDVLADSRSQRDFLETQGVVPPGRIDVLADGSICGVDSRRFRPDLLARSQVRRELNIPDDALMLLFVGRLTRDKGILDLIPAVRALARRKIPVFLAVVGPDEEGMADAALALWPDHGGRLIFVGLSPAPERFMAAADIFCLPSYREGFGSVIIEAAACGLPAVASRIYGLTDAVADTVTGFLHPPGDSRAIEAALTTLAEDPQLRRRMGEAARRRAVELFDQPIVTRAFAAYIQSRIPVAGAPRV